MTAPLVVVTGTGTEIGKTHLSVALLHRWGRDARVVGAKPVETGVRPGEMGEDLARLTAASTFHVKQALAQRYAFRRPVSPHLAAMDEGATIDVRRIVADVRSLRQLAEGVLVELPGGLFSPLTLRRSNADVARALHATATILVAPDRLGVLHDVVAAATAAASIGVGLTGIVLMAPANPDASTGTNAEALRSVADLPLLASLPRASESTLGESEELERVFNAMFGGPPRAHARGGSRRPPPPSRTRRRA